jgi:hypothetical protein
MPAQVGRQNAFSGAVTFSSDRCGVQRQQILLRGCYALSFALSASPGAGLGFPVGRKPPDWRLHKSA